MMTLSLRTEDGVPLHGYRWPGSGRGRVLLVHGYGEHAGRYETFAAWLAQQGWAVWACDLRGHGRSPGPRGHIRSFQDYVRDVAALQAAGDSLAPQGPCVLLGHSLGGLIALRYVQVRKPTLQGLVLSAPFLGLAFPVPSWKRWTAPWLSRLWPSFTSPNGINPDFLSRDPAITQAYAHDPWVHRVVTARWFAETLQAQREAMAHAGEVNLPLFLLLGQDDRIADGKKSQELFASVRSQDKELKIYPGFRHEPLNEVGKEQAWQDVAAWLGKHT